jgi:hypothetical protein
VSDRFALTYIEIDVPTFPPSVILLHFDAINSPPDSPPIIFDENTAGQDHIWSSAGNAAISSATFKFGNASLLLDGTGDFSTTPDSQDFSFGVEDFTIDCWFNCTATGGTTRNLAGQRDSGLTAAGSAWAISRTTGNVMRFEAFVGSSTFTVTGTTQFTDVLNTGWNHIACVRVGNILRLFINGSQQGGDQAITGSLNNSIQLIGIGSLGGSTANSWLGSIDEFRMTIGTARWTSNFTPPTAADTPVTYRFALDTSYLPSTIDAIPNVIDVNLTPAIISLGQDLGSRGSLTVQFRDHRHKFGSDAFSSGSFWGKFRAQYGLKLQGKPLRFIQGFVGQSIDAMESRSYLIEAMDGPGADGIFRIVAKDLFKQLDGDRAQAPLPSNGFVSANITNVAASFTVLPTGVGDAEYPASGFLNLGGKEIVSFTRTGDTVNITRAQFNTTAQAHNAQTRAQLCLNYSAIDVASILRDLMVTYGGVSSLRISLSAWQAETTAFLPAIVYSALITEPTSVNKLVSELIEQAGLVLWWDDLGRQFRLQVLRAIATNAAVYDAKVIIGDSLKVTEQPTKRLSQVYVYFDKLNPLIAGDQLDNYRSTAFNRNAEAEREYGGIAIKKIYSRWIPTGGRSIADMLVAILLSRFRDPPRRLNFQLFRDEVGNIPLLGVGYQVEAWCFQNTDGTLDQIPVQLTSIGPYSDHFDVEAEEMLFTAIPAVSPADHVVIFDASINNVNLQTVHDNIYTPAVSGTTINCFIYPGVIIGSSNAANPSFTVGTFVAGVTVNLTILGRIEGKGGDGGGGALGGSTLNGTAGGTAMFTTQNINLTDTSGQIWGGGGGGGGGGPSLFAGTQIGGGGGGGGAGSTPGTHGNAGGAGGFAGMDGSTEVGGTGGTTSIHPSGVGGNGGGPGQAGANGALGNTGAGGGTGAAAGRAIDGISHITTIGTAGDRRGAQVN